MAARTLFAKQGYGEVGTETIIKAANVSRGALYHHFADKVELFAAVFEAVEADALERITAVVSVSSISDPIELMRLAAAAWLDVCADPEVHRILLIEAPAVLGWARWREISTRYGGGMTQHMLARAMTAKRIPKQPIEPLAHVLLGALREAALYLAAARGKVAARREVGEVLDALIRSLATA